MALIDRGDTYRVGYLGCVMMSQVGTGLGVLQKPLRQMYFNARKPNGETRAQERYLLMSRDGLSVTFKDSPDAPPQEIFYDVPSIVFWDAVQFATVRGSDKKIKGAFEPLDDNHSRSKDNIFSLVEKKYHYIAQLTHPPLFTCVLRRTSGVKALDVHAFVCSSDEESLSLIRTLNVVQHQYKAGEVHGTGVFEYSPFRQPLSPSSAPGTPVFPLPPSPRSPVDVSRNVQSADPSRRQQHQHVQQQMAPNVQTVATGAGHQVYQLKQDDFYVRGRLHSADSTHSDRRGYTDHPSEWTDSFNSGHDQGRNRFAESDYEVYSEIIEHDSRLTPSTAGRSDEQFTRKIEYQSITKHIDLFEDTLNPSIPNEYFYQQRQNTPTHRQTPVSPQNDRVSGQSPTSKLGQGYSLLTGSQSPIPGQNTPRYADEEYDNGSGREPQVGRHHGQGQGQHVGYNREQPRSRFTSHSSATPPPSPQSVASQNDEVSAVKHGHYDVPKRSYSVNSYNDERHVTGKVNPVHPGDSNNVSVSEMKKRLEGKSEILRSASIDRVDLYDVPRQPPRPVAKVHPHKIQGVRVLPDPASLQTPLKITAVTEQPNPRPKSMGLYDNSMDYDQNSSHQPFKRSSNERTKQANNSGNRPPQENYQSNWQFKSPASKDVDFNKRDNGGNTPGSPMNDKLLLSKKKDAEIASVLQDLSFDHGHSKPESSGLLGTDFERSLGYLP